VYPLLILFEEAASAQKGWESGMEPSPVVAESPQGTTNQTTEYVIKGAMRNGMETE